MKKLILSSLMMIIATMGYSQIKMSSTGNVALGYSPSTIGTAYKVYSSSFYTGSTMYLGGYQNSIIFDFYGYGERRMRPTSNNRGSVGSSTHAFNAMYSYAFNTVSDGRQKENIKSLKGSLDIIMSLRGVQYDYKKEYLLPKETTLNGDQLQAIEKQRKNQIGFIAQEVQKVLPKVVAYDDSTDVYGVDYAKVVPVLVEAIKEQQAKIDELVALTNRLLEDDKTVDDLLQTDPKIGYKLFQNFPNPSDGTTEIKYEVPQGIGSGSIRIYDLNGKQVKSYSLSQSQSIIINDGELSDGVYLYSLIVDGDEKGMKKMIIGQ